MERQPVRQTDRSPATGYLASLDLRQAEPGVVRGDDHVACERHLQAAAERRAANGSDDRLARRPGYDAKATAVFGDRSFTGRGEGFQVHAGAERAALAGDDGAAQLVVRLQLVKRGRDPQRGWVIDRI